MGDVKSCAFCNVANFEGRTIRLGELYVSFVSRPWFRWGQCLVVPRRHIVTLAELSPQESTAIIAELGRLSERLDQGSGTGVMQKYQPLQPDNGVKVGHLHFHVFPRFKD